MMSEGVDDTMMAQVKLGRSWEAVGPFPSGMREHPMMSSPLHAFDPKQEGFDIDVDFARRPFVEAETWPSELAFGGEVGWKRFDGKEDGSVQLSYPDIDWDQLRSDHGWAALQYSSILRTSLQVPRVDDGPTPLLIDVVQGVEYAFVPAKGECEGPVTWYQGDLYGYADTPAGLVHDPSRPSNFARSIALDPGEYVMLIRAIYEIRMFGDPGPGEPPVIHLRVNVKLDEVDDVEVMRGLTVVPEVRDGWAMGRWASLGIRVIPTGENLELEGQGSVAGLTAKTPGPISIVPGQIRMIPFTIEQTSPLDPTTKGIDVTLNLKTKSRKWQVTWTMPLNPPPQRPQNAFRMTFASSALSADGDLPSLVSHAMVIPPPQTRAADTSAPVILGTHGAGVDVESPFWVEAIPVEITGGWAVLPTGKNEWGEDWHGGSMADAWAARDALPLVIERLGHSIPKDTLLIGHSNGGQGAWHLAARYPDRIVGVIAVAGYNKIQTYVPYTESASSHYTDPSLTGILNASLTPYDNDLYLSNLSHIPILAIHGSVDNNVLPRHGRLQASLVKSWTGKQNDAKVTFIEVPGESHWWTDAFRSSEVSCWIQSFAKLQKSNSTVREEGFTLTTANPDESGSKAGIRILEVDIPGRLARLDVNGRQWKDDRPSGSRLDLRGTNIRRIEIMPEMVQGQPEIIDLRSPRSTPSSQDDSNVIEKTPRRYGPMIRILSTNGPISIVVGSTSSGDPIGHHLSLARRIAHDLLVYHRVDVKIVSDHQVVSEEGRSESGGNWIVLGRPSENVVARWILSRQHNKSPISFPDSRTIEVSGRKLADRGSGIITLQPSPVGRGLSCVIAGNDADGLETAARLMPIRTGVPIPDWVVVGPRMSWQGAGGIIGAGFWNAEWGWSEPMSWFDRVSS